MGAPDTVALVKRLIFMGMFVQVLALLAAGGSGVALLGTRTDSLALEKQKRGPRAFMTTLLVLLPSAYFLSSWAASGAFDARYYGVQGVEILGELFCVVMIGLNIRDGLALRGRISVTPVSGPTIEARDGGPLVVTQAPSLTDADGGALELRPVMALCRCGASKRKPFCDGSHNDIAFDSSAETDASKDQILTYAGEPASVHYNRLLCSHAAECGRRQKAAFDSSRTPWIVPDNASEAGLREVVQACPSGALRLSVHGATPAHLLPDSAGITVERDGPYRVSGVALAQPRLAKGASPDKFVLCRCGASKNKPYCDGSHVDIGWKAEA